MSVTKLIDVCNRYIGVRHVTIASSSDSNVTDRLLCSKCNDSNVTDMQLSDASNDSTVTENPKYCYRYNVTDTFVKEMGQQLKGLKTTYLLKMITPVSY